MLRRAPELEVRRRDDEEEAVVDLEVDDPVRRGAQASLQRDHLRPSVRHVHLGGPIPAEISICGGRRRCEESERACDQFEGDGTEI